jgi:hypothetical protein
MEKFLLVGYGGYGKGIGCGSGYSDGNGYGYGQGIGYGRGYYDCDCFGYGDGYGNGDGFGECSGRGNGYEGTVKVNTRRRG